jgi:hypothetical protein
MLTLIRIHKIITPRLQHAKYVSFSEQDTTHPCSIGVDSKTAQLLQSPLPQVLSEAIIYACGCKATLHYRTAAAAVLLLLLLLEPAHVADTHERTVGVPRL